MFDDVTFMAGSESVSGDSREIPNVNTRLDVKTCCADLSW
jgi:hypothetical protein